MWKVDQEILRSVAGYYADKLSEHGATSKGVDWKDDASQMLRFQELLRTVQFDGATSILDFGCGFGSLYSVLRNAGFRGNYTGLDISEEMVEKARELNGVEGARWTTALVDGERFDYVLASGVFNVKLDHNDDNWRDYMKTTLEAFDRRAMNGFAFNVLTSYSDLEYRREDLFYADPLEWFDYCKREFSPRVVLNHGYPLYEFTVAVLKG